MEFKKAKRSQVKVKVAISGPSGSGKTMSSLLMAFGLVHAEHPDWSYEKCWESICVIDTENGSGSLYVGTQVGSTKIGEYNVIDMAPPYSPQSFVDAIHMCEDHDMEVIIIDSLSHAWSGEGGALDQQGAIAARSGNSYTAWRTVTPQHNKLVDTMLQSRCHVFADMRAKMDYQQVTGENGKKQVKAVGMNSIMREGIEYEFTVCFMLDYEHIANAIKDRTGVFDGQYFTITSDTGRKLYKWLSEGAPVIESKAEPEPAPVSEPRPVSAPAEEHAEDDTSLAKALEMTDAVIKKATEGMSAEEKSAVGDRIKEICGMKNYKKCTDIEKLRELYKEFALK